MKKNSSLVGVSLLISIGFSLKAIAIPVPNTYINFAGAGGDFDSRTATFRDVYKRQNLKSANKFTFFNSWFF